MTRVLVLVPWLFGCAASQRAATPPVVAPAVVAPPVERNELRAGVLSDASRQFLEDADVLELVAVERGGRGSYAERGKALIRDAATRRELIAALDAGFREATEYGMCFDPGHVLRATLGGETLELWICFKCFRVMAEGKGASGIPGAISRSPEAVVDRILGDHGVPPAAPRR